MNEYMKRAAELWHAGVPEILGTGRSAYIISARATFVILSLLGGFTREAVAEYAGWEPRQVDYYAGKVFTDERTLEKLLSKGFISIAV